MIALVVSAGSLFTKQAVKKLYVQRPWRRNGTATQAITRTTNDKKWHG
jgi:hypothetical protein